MAQNYGSDNVSNISSDLTIMAKVLQFRNPNKMVFGSEISSNEDELDFELLRNEINYILECILVNAL